VPRLSDKGSAREMDMQSAKRLFPITERHLAITTHDFGFLYFVNR